MKPLFENPVVPVVGVLVLGYCYFLALTILCMYSNQSLLQHESLCTQWLQCHKHEQLPLGYLLWLNIHVIKVLVNEVSRTVSLFCVCLCVCMFRNHFTTAFKGKTNHSEKLQ